MTKHSQPSFDEDNSISIVLDERRTLLPRYRVSSATLESTRIMILGLYGVMTILTLLIGIKHAFIRVSRELPFWVFFLSMLHFSLSLLKIESKNLGHLLGGLFQATWTLAVVNLLILLTLVIPFINLNDDPFFAFHTTISVFVFVTVNNDFVMNRIRVQSLISFLLILLTFLLYGCYLVLSDPYKIKETVSIFCYNKHKIAILTGLYLFTSFSVWNLYTALHRLKHKTKTRTSKKCSVASNLIQKE